MVDSLVFSLSEFLQLLDVDFRLKGTVKSKIDELRTELRQWEPKLKELEAGSINHEDIREISGGITELSYGAGDKLIYIAEADGGKFKKFIRYVRAAKYFDRILRRIIDMRPDYSSFTSEHRHDPSAAEEDVRSRNVTTYVAHEFVEREEETKQLLSYLVEESEHCQVIAISGIGGAGKTTLAERLLEHPVVRIHYRGRPLVPVSRKFHRRKIFTAILEKLDQPSGENDSEEDLGKRISKYLDKYKRLIVLDDIWSLDDWEFLKVILPRSCKSKILFTTRLKQVAENANRGLARCVHLKSLTLEKGCELLKKKDPDSTMGEDLQKKIVNFCGGLPLTIVSFSRSMVGNHPLVKWKEMVSHRLNCASNRRLELPEVRKTLEVLASSYDNLPYILKLFFLFMGVLQEDLRIEVEKLYLFWLAERLISLKPLQRGERLLDVAQSYVTELAERGMVDLEEDEVPTITRFKYGQLTEIMRDLSLFKNKEECFFKVVEFEDGNQPMPDSFSSLPGPRTCRVAINFDEYKEGYGFPLEDDEKMHIRVLLFSTKKKQIWPLKLSSLAKFKYLKVLLFNGFNFELTILPHGIATAAFLRYLSFEDCILQELPSSIGNLKFLYILDLRVQNTMIIPNVLWKLEKIRHLYFPLSFETPDGTKLTLNGLKELETITNYNAKMCNVEDLFGLPNLQYLASTVDGNLEEVECIIRRMTMNPDVDLLRTSIKIKNFDCYTEERHSVFRKLLACESLRVLHMEGHICRMPPYHKFSQNLIKFEFIGSELIEDPMKTLEELPKLRELVLDDAFIGKEIVCSASGFVELKLLRLLNLPHLKNWVVKGGAMPKLSTLAISKCRKLEMWPEGLKTVRGLRELKVSGMSQNFKNCISKGRDQDKLSIKFED
ncbi:Apoptotic ATPase [Handroanthus impetiginosus]|uniref:Apoptotic ATPase n=1 Tax=Handroanthus impetiginosus TaxID=429701 RepID=A0A2G9I141_9LAMI|nr:Apoptotic ATPase [Handroanthus impetiginosus]